MAEEYTSGELMRGIESLGKQVRLDFGKLETRIDGLSTKFVPMDLYLRDRAEHSNDIADLKTENTAQRNALDEQRKSLAESKQREDDAKARVRLQWLGIAAAPFVGAFAVFIFNGGLAR